MEKKNFAKITFVNFNLDYDCTICEWSDVSDQLEAVKDEFVDDDSKYHDKYGRPQIIIEPIAMTDQEFEKWFKDNVEANA